MAQVSMLEACLSLPRVVEVRRIINLHFPGVERPTLDRSQQAGSQGVVDAPHNAIGDTAGGNRERS